MPPCDRGIWAQYPFSNLWKQLLAAGTDVISRGIRVTNPRSADVHFLRALRDVHENLIHPQLPACSRVLMRQSNISSSGVKAALQAEWMWVWGVSLARW